MTKQLHDGDTTGVVVGRDSADKVAFHGSTPVAQQSVTGTLTSGNTTAADSAAIIVKIRDALEALGLITSV